MKLHTRFFLTSVAVAVLSLTLSGGLLIATGALSSNGGSRGVAVLAVGLLAALATAFLLARAASLPLTRRLNEIAARARRQAGRGVADTALSGLPEGPHDPVGHRGDDEVGRVAHGLGQVAGALRRGANALVAERSRTAAILEGMAEGVLVIDVSGRIQTANHAVRAMLGMDGDPARHQYLEWIRHPEVTGMITAALHGERAEASEVTLHGPIPKVLVARARPFAAEEQRGAVLVFHDVTAQRRADGVRQNFVANVSHELRTPLTAIRGSVETLLDERSSDDGDAPFLAIIARNSARMERLVNDLLRLARLDAGQDVLAPTSCQVAAMFDAIEHELEPMITAKGQRIETTVEDSAARVTADPVKLHDALRNLVENAVAYAPAGSVITLAARHDGGVTRLSVADRGPGIPDADLARVFERFYRVDAARSREVGGTGLGLSIVKHLVGLHGGSVQATHREGGGCIFTIALPRPA
ncbi:MAG: ATP-binding protein [Acidobacteria bacterium]|nr:ATP-binding protein [Acidobacteriota bacterium]